MALRVIHNSLPGRLRVRAEELRDNTAKLQRITQELREVTGIHQVETNTLTGSVLALYDPAMVEERTLLLRLMGIAEVPLVPSSPEDTSVKLSAKNSMDIPRLPQAIEEPFHRLNTGFFRLTNGYMDLRYLVPVLLMAYGTSKLIRQGPVPAVPWYLLYWWSFRTFVVLNGPTK